MSCFEWRTLKSLLQCLRHKQYPPSISLIYATFQPASTVSCSPYGGLFWCIRHAWPPLWSSGQNSWLQIQMSGYNSRRYHIFWEVVGLEWGPLSLASTTEELLWRESSASGLENWENCKGESLYWPRDTLYSQKLALTSPTSGGRSVSIDRSRTEATEFGCSST
jgi:hypothetical protein